MAMCIHSQEFETCQFGCTFRRANELRLENDRLRKALKKYGTHGVVGGDICEASKHSDYSCTCGFEQALK